MYLNMAANGQTKILSMTKKTLVNLKKGIKYFKYVIKGKYELSKQIF